jgi:hypothetical protein
VAWFDVFLKFSALVGGALAILTFWRTAKVRRAEWLSSLHTKFFEGSGYKEIRRILDGNDTDPDFSQLRSSIAARQSTSLVDAFDDYLNFFEFVATLRKLRQLKPREISMMFDYYLRLLCKHDFVRSYIRTYGFEELEALIVECVEGKK